MITKSNKKKLSLVEVFSIALLVEYLFRKIKKREFREKDRGQATGS